MPGRGRTARRGTPSDRSSTAGTIASSSSTRSATCCSSVVAELGCLGHGHAPKRTVRLARRTSFAAALTPLVRLQLRTPPQPDGRAAPRRAARGCSARIRATSARLQGVVAPLVAGPQVGQHAHDDQARAAVGSRWSVVPRQRDRRSSPRSDRRAPWRSSGSPVNGSAKASASAALRTRKCIGMPMPTTGMPARRPTSIITVASRIGSPRRRTRTTSRNELRGSS